MKNWVGETACQICGKEISSILVDGRIHSGQWAVMCFSCFQRAGVGLGVGKGQKYKLDKEKKEFLKEEK